MFWEPKALKLYLMSVLLVVDDEISIQKSIERLFIDDDSIEVLTASGAMEALGILAKHQVDVIISDERMPQISGSQLLQDVKELHPTIKRILITGYPGQAVNNEAIKKAEVFNLLLKPWEPDELVATVKLALSK